MQENINIPDSTITTNLSFRNLVLMNMQQLTNFPYIEKDFDALTDYELLCLVVKFLNDVIANQNEQNASITRMYESFLALQTYVNNTKDSLEDAFNNLDNYVRNYFDNLDVQDEINNKLDQMLEDGVLEQIIEQFLQSTALWCFDTVADMKLATNLINGSYAKTLGYHTKNDGGSSLYKIRTITNDDVIDEATIISLNDVTLIAELIVNSSINIKQFGAYGDNTHDDLQPIQKAINYIIDKKVKLVSDTATYKITDTIEIIGDNLVIEFNGTLVNTSSEFTIELKNSNYCNIYIRSITALSGSGVKIITTKEEDYTSCNYNNISFNRIRCNGISLDTYSENSMQYNSYKWNILESKTKNISITKLEDGHAWNNESIFNGGKLGGYDNTVPTNNIYISSNSSSMLIDGHKFNNVGLEGGNISVYLKNAYGISLNKPRTLEDPTTKTLELSSTVDCCHFDFLSAKLSYLDYSNSSGTNYFTGIFITNDRSRMRFNSFMIKNGNMMNCNQRELYYIEAGTSTYSFPTNGVFPNMFRVTASFKLDTHYYNSTNINEIYLRIGGIDASLTTQILDQNDNVIADISGIRYKWYKMTIVPSTLSTTALLEEMSWTY